MKSLDSLDPLDPDSDKLTLEGDLGPRSPLRTVQVLHELALSKTGVPLALLAQRLQLPKTSLFRLLRSLESGGYVTSENGVHQIGPAALKLGAALVQNREFPNCARPAMNWLAAKCSETIILGMISDNGFDVIYAEVIEATNPLRFITKAGTVKPLYCSANGLAILAHMPPDEIRCYLDAVSFVRLTPKTINSVSMLKTRLKQIRASGVAVSEEGMFEGVYSIAAPVVDAAGSVRAGVSISAPSTRGLRQETSFASLVTRAGEEISRLLGFMDAYPPK
jgi:DNA-binding IclR family transcriptional regulator